MRKSLLVLLVCLLLAVSVFAQDSAAIKKAVASENSEADMLELHPPIGSLEAVSYSPFVDAFLASVSMIVVSELGDKTFFIAAIMAMTNNRSEIFISAAGALFVMTVLSVFMGVALPVFIPRSYTHYASCLLFLIFAVKLLSSVFFGGEDDDDEMEEVEKELAGCHTDDIENQRDSLVSGDKIYRIFAKCFSPIMIQCFTMTFLAEWGDRSQIATIAMAASRDPYGVAIGGSFGHMLCTGLAVVGGKMLASRISEKTVNIVGGILFLIFALIGFISGEDV